MHYFFDNCLSYKYARCLAALGKDVVALRDELLPNISDIELLQKLQGRDAVFVSLDLRQLTTSLELYELKKCGCTAIYFSPSFSNLKFWQQITWIIQKWETIEGFVQGAAKGTIAEIKANGKARPMHF